MACRVAPAIPAVTVAATGTVSITLPATDGDPLRFLLVTKPKHGLLLGFPPALTYTPDSGYAGLGQLHLPRQ